MSVSFRATKAFLAAMVYQFEACSDDIGSRGGPKGGETVYAKLLALNGKAGIIDLTSDEQDELCRTLEAASSDGNLEPHELRSVHAAWDQVEKAEAVKPDPPTAAAPVSLEARKWLGVKRATA